MIFIEFYTACKISEIRLHFIKMSQLNVCSLSSLSAWLRGEEDPVVETINDRMEAITGLDMTTAEELQVEP